MNKRQMLLQRYKSNPKIAELLRLGHTDDWADAVEQILESAQISEKEATMTGVRFKAYAVDPATYARMTTKEQSVKPSAEARILEQVCAANGWNIDHDAEPLFDEWVAKGYNAALAMATTCKSARITPAEYATRSNPTDRFAAAVQNLNANDWRAR